MIGGLAGGIAAHREGRNFWNASNTVSEDIVFQDISLVLQKGEYNCLPASVEAVDGYFQGTLTQNEVRGWFGGKGPLDDKNVWTRYSLNTEKK